VRADVRCKLLRKEEWTREKGAGPTEEREGRRVNCAHPDQINAPLIAKKGAQKKIHWAKEAGVGADSQETGSDKLGWSQSAIKNS